MVEVLGQPGLERKARASCRTARFPAEAIIAETGQFTRAGSSFTGNPLVHPRSSPPKFAPLTSRVSGFNLRKAEANRIGKESQVTSGEQPHKPLAFSELLLEELGMVRTRQRHRDKLPDNPPRANTPVSPSNAEANPKEETNAPAAADKAPPEDESRRKFDDPWEDKANKQAHEMNVRGLALSGGGIRSATFNLGVLQALAQLELLGQFDYLSTVSGGGYIGSWLAAWIKREGSVENVEIQLRPSRVAHLRAILRGANLIDIRDREPEPIAHLRAYSNYMTPRLGWFSWDSWILGAIYLRNFLLNQLILLPCVVVVLLLARAILWQFQHMSEWPLSPWASAAFAIGLTFLAQSSAVYAIWVLRLIRDRRRRGRFMRNLGPWSLNVLIVLPAMLAAIISAGLLFNSRTQSGETLLLWKFPAYGVALAFPSLVLGVVVLINAARAPARKELRREAAWWLISGIVAGPAGAALLWVLEEKLVSRLAGSDAGVAAGVLVTPPLVLAIFMVVNFLQTGLLGQEVTGTLPRRAAGAIRRCEALGTT
jgi:hypothetical protein